MKAVFAEAARRDLEDILIFLETNYPTVISRFEARLERIIALIEEQPESGARVGNRPNLRVVPFTRYPYRLFYRIRGGFVEVLHIRHTARRPWSEAG